MQQIGQDIDQGREQDIHARRGNLHHHMVAVAVDHQAGQPVAFTMAQAVKGMFEQALAQGQGVEQAGAQQIRVQRGIRLAADQPRRDEGSRIDVGRAQHTLPGVGHVYRLTRRKGGQGRAFDVHFIAEHPQVSGAQSAVLAALQV